MVPGIFKTWVASWLLFNFLQLCRNSSMASENAKQIGVRGEGLSEEKQIQGGGIYEKKCKNELAQ